MWTMPSMYLTERSYWFAERGTRTDSAKRATTDFSLKMVRKLKAVGNVDGSRALKIAISRTRTTSRAFRETARTIHPSASPLAPERGDLSRRDASDDSAMGRRSLLS